MKRKLEIILVIMLAICGCASGGHGNNVEPDSGSNQGVIVRGGSEVRHELIDSNPEPVDGETSNDQDGEESDSRDASVELSDSEWPSGEGDDSGRVDIGQPDTGTRDTGGFDTGGPDAEELDASKSDSGNLDAGEPDAESPDSETPDSGLSDSSEPDTGTIDAGEPDTGDPDTGSPDSSGSDSGEPDTGPPIVCSNSACDPIGDAGTQQQRQSFASVETITCTDGVDEWDEQRVCDYSDECMDRECMPCLEEHAGAYTTLELDGGDEVVVDCIGCKCYLWWRVDNSVRCPDLFPEIISFEPGLYIRDLTMSFQVTVSANGTATIESTAPGTVVTEYAMSDFEYNVGHSALFDLWVVGYVDGRPFEVNTNLVFVCL